jgi:Cd2+/Zn2+-exporting ATPase
MGAAGSDTAIETADIALMGDDLGRLAFVIGLSRRALRIIRANIAFALAVKALVIGLTFLGLTSLWLAILADTGATLLVVANSMRLLRYQPWDGRDGPAPTSVAAANTEAGAAAV